MDLDYFATGDPLEIFQQLYDAHPEREVLSAIRVDGENPYHRSPWLLAIVRCDIYFYLMRLTWIDTDDGQFLRIESLAGSENKHELRSQATKQGQRWLFGEEGAFDEMCDQFFGPLPKVRPIYVFIPQPLDV